MCERIAAHKKCLECSHRFLCLGSFADRDFGCDIQLVGNITA
jgi:hypothetical protein